MPNHVNSMLPNFPAALKASGLFCVWRREGNSDKPRKVLYNPATGRRGSSKDPARFTDFETAAAVYQRGGYDGIGIGFFGDLYGIDIDHCISASGTYSPVALDIIDAVDGYTERSPSGTGVHVLFRAPGFSAEVLTKYGQPGDDLNAAFSRRWSVHPSGAGVEFYGEFSPRYFTVTGDAIRAGSLETDKTPALLPVLDKYYRRPTRAAAPAETETETETPAPAPSRADLIAAAPSYDDDTIMRAMLRSPTKGARINALLRGDLNRYAEGGEVDESDADIGLLNDLAYFTCGNAAQMERLFNRFPQSRREKWRTRKDYRDRQIAAAIRDCRGKYDPAAYAAQRAADELPDEAGEGTTFYDDPIDDAAAEYLDEPPAADLEAVDALMDEDGPKEGTAPPEWFNLLHWKESKHGAVLVADTHSAATIFENDEEFAGFALNTMSGTVEVTGHVPWPRDPGKLWRASDTSHLSRELNRRYYNDFPRAVVDDAFIVATNRRRFNPLTDWLATLPPWDGTQRIGALLTRLFGAEESEYTAAVMRKTLIAAVARAYNPGCKFDFVPVLDGAQGIGKSTFWRVLAGDEYFTDSLTLEDMRDKTAGEKVQGYWFCEIAELAGMRKADIQTVRSFVSRQNDDYRAPYARISERRPRRCVLVGTVNGSRGYLRDPEGDRRFWPVKLAPDDGRSRTISDDERAQIWAEARHLYNGGNCEPLYMHTPALQEAAQAAQKGAREYDERAALVETYLNTPLPNHWATLPLGERIYYLQSPQQPRGNNRRMRVSGLEIWLECFGGDKDKFTRREQDAIAQIMRTFSDWKECQGRAYYTYGRARVGWIRVKGNPDLH